jgi:predicted  nucleic acid-binding Zn-ribbon protein
MSEIERIRGFLRTVRRRAYWEAFLRVGGLTLTAMILALLIMSLCAAHIGPATFWPKVTLTVLIILTLLGASAAALGPWRRLRSERAVAAYVGRSHPPIASDLLSAVELARLPEQPGTSTSILGAFFGVVAARVEPLDPRRLVPFRAALWSAGALLGAALLLSAGLLWLPDIVGRGLGFLTRFPTRFEGAAVATEPLIGDVRVTYVYPEYTRLPKRVVEGSTGDIVALKGTEVEIETRLLRSARQALLLLGENGESGEHPVQLADGKLKASFRLSESGAYRVWMAPLIGRPVREGRPHRIVVEVDQAPRVEIFGPADRLEIATPRPIEVGFSASDDFGLGPIELVYRVNDGPEQRVRLKEGEAARNAQGRTVFEPNLQNEGPGATVGYRIEAKDLDGVSGAKTGSSRTLYLVIQNPRENLDEQLLRQRDVLEKLLDNLADRLEILETPAAAQPGLDLGAHLATWLSLHEAEESQVAALGRIIDDERRSGSAGKNLLTALSGIADRLSRRLRQESDLLGSLRGKADQGILGASAFDKLFRHGAKHVEDLETSVLLLDDLISRQRLEDLAAAAKDLTDAYKRLQDLLARYEATKDEALRRQIEREIRDLRARIQELAEKIAAVRARNEVPTEWQNMPDMKEALEQAEQFSQLLDKGDTGSLQKALSQLGSTLDDLRKMLDKNADDFGATRFQQENKALSDLLRKVGDLEGDERALAVDSGALAQEMDEELSKKMAAELEKFLQAAREKLDRLRSKLGTPTPRELNEDGQDELKRAQESARQLRRLLPEREWGEAKKEAERAISSLRQVRRQLDERAGSKRSPSPTFEEFRGAMNEAGTLAQELASELDRLVPKGSEQMSPEQRARAQGMAQRQGSLGQRAEELAQEAGRNAGKAQGMDQAAQELRAVGRQMGEAQQDLARGNPREGSGRARDAADRLAKLRDSLEEGRRGGRGRNQREPVRIPGADESKAPREWRQELMEAMRERAPERYGDEVRRYYEELVK